MYDPQVSIRAYAGSDVKNAETEEWNRQIW